jgi:DNA-directed RNA polymerase omega subunit
MKKQTMIKPIEIETLESKAGNIYEAVVVCAKRARQINDEQKLEHTQRLEPLKDKEEEDENVISKDKMNISLDFEKRLKPTQISLTELLDDKIEFKERTEE